MAKALGLIGNFTGKLGNTVGYNLKDSNNKQTQGVRVYQPVVKNPRTAGQAEQRAKLAPINATYRALKDIIDRGQEGKAYGNKSRLAWLSDAMKAFDGGWFEKGATINMPALVPLTKGSLANIPGTYFTDVSIGFPIEVTEQTQGSTIGHISTCILAANPGLKEGDQITAVAIISKNDGLLVEVHSIVIDTTSTASFGRDVIVGDTDFDLFVAEDTSSLFVAGACIVSREGDNGAHLRSTTSLTATSKYDSDLLAPAAKAAAIASYMSQGANTDWAEESIM